MKIQYFSWTIFCCFAFIFVACSDDEMDLGSDVEIDPRALEISEVVKDNFSPVKADPLNWTDAEMTFLDEWADKKIIGVGEATHGTKEFFDAKFRILTYMVENHGFKTFAIEADFGESIFIDEAIQAGDKSVIRALMHDKMHFWTWRTEEVYNLIIWMIDYNEGKAPEDKLHYVGVDCQFNTFHPVFVQDYLDTYSTELGEESFILLSDLKNLSDKNHEGISMDDFNRMLTEVDELIVKFEAQKPNLVELTDLETYELNRRYLELCRQVFIVGTGRHIDTGVSGDRDFYMAENALWYQQEFLGGDKMIMWQHNYHVSKLITYGPSGSLGYNLDRVLGLDYQVIAFSFGKGGFTAVEQAGSTYLGLKSHFISDEPKSGSLNEYFYLTDEPAFAVKVSDLRDNLDWDNLFLQGVDMLNIGAVYNRNPNNYYGRVAGHFWDVYIHFQETTASEQLN